MDKLMWVKKLRQILSPGYVVNLCFFIVFCFSTLLIWREIKVLEEAYVANQRNNLENVSHEFDSLLQFNIDRMIFFRNGMQSALGTPLDFVVLRKAEEDYLKKRHDPLWSVEIHNRRTLPMHLSTATRFSLAIMPFPAMSSWPPLSWAICCVWLITTVVLRNACCTYRAAVFLPPQSR